jgi:hypothetical protein
MFTRTFARALVVLATSGVLFVGVAALPASAAKPSPPTSLDGESFDAIPTFSNEACNPGGTSSFDYSASGVASGPYAGTFSETGTVIIGQQTIPNESSFPVGTLSWKSGPVTALQATFTIQSPLGVVTGTKTLVTPGLGGCQDTAQFQSIFGGTQTVPVLLRQANATLSYTATIPTSKKTYCNNGNSTVNMGEFAAGDFGTPESPHFHESFASSSVAAEHGQKGC